MKMVAGAVSILGRLAHEKQRGQFVTAILRRRFQSSNAAAEDHSSALELWSWGKGETGQLGLGDEETRRFPCFVQSLPLSSPSSLASQSNAGAGDGLRNTVGKDERESVSSSSNPLVRSMHTAASSSLSSSSSRAAGHRIACGLFHSAVWGDGRLWMWGKGSGGRLGLGSEDPRYTPSLVSSLIDVESVALGGLHSAAIANGGSLYTWGFGGFGALGHGGYSKVMSPKKLEGAEWMQNVKQVSAGGSHTAAISASGELYTWGRDEGDGRLGQREGRAADDGSEPSPVRVEALPVPIATIACGGFCTMALTPEGQLWSWGGNSNYELGRGNRRDDWRPMPIPEIEDTQIIQMACGGYHSAALTVDGKVLTWGHGGHGQLGHGTLFTGRVPCMVEALSNQNIVAIACGSTWTAAVTESGELYTWGKNRDSQLGVPSLPDTQMTPVLVRFDEIVECDDETQIMRAVDVSAGATHGIALVCRKIENELTL